MLPFDHALFMLVNANASTPAAVVALAKWLSLGLPVCLGVAIIAALVFASSPVKRSLLVVLASVALAALIAYLIRQYLPSTRPAQMGWGIQWIHHSMRSAFPSMHATQAFALAQALLLAPAIRRMNYGRLVIAVSWICALAISWSRMCLGVHIPSDVLGGAVVGIGAASVTAAAAHHLFITVRGKSSTYSSHPAHP